MYESNPKSRVDETNPSRRKLAAEKARTEQSWNNKFKQELY